MACLLFALVLSVPNALKAQTTMASLDGIVTDSSGAVIPGATVELVNEGTNVKQINKTDERGYYFFKFLLPASYRLTVTVNGFETFVRSGMVLEVQQVARVDVALKPGTISTKVEVTGEAPRLDTANATQGQVVNNTEMTNLPELGRNPLAFAQLSPNIVGVGGQPQGGAQNFSANGGRLDTTDVLLDGVTINVQDPNSGVHDTLFTPTTDEVQEMKVQTNTYSAEYGLSGNAIITIVSRTGTNHLHGDIFEYHSDNDLDAQGFFANMAGAKIPVSRNNLFGGVVGGPVYIPKVYDGRNKTFFFEHYERVDVPGSPDPYTASVPSALEKSGDFSQSETLGPNNTVLPVTVYNPNQYNPNACATINGQQVCGIRAPYPGNGSGSGPGTYIDPSTWNPVAQHVIPFYPSPNVAGSGPAHVGNYYWVGKSVYNWYEQDIRVDQNFTANQRLAVRYSRQPTSSLVDSNPWGAGNYMAPDGIYSGSGSKPQHATANYTNVINPTTILNVQYGVIRFHSSSGIIDDPRNWSWSSWGYKEDLGINRPPGFFTDDKYSDIGPSLWSGDYGSAAGTSQTTHQISGSLTKVKGIHSFKVGGEQRFTLMNQMAPGINAASFDICQADTEESPTTSAPGQGASIASLMAGWGEHCRGTSYMLTSAGIADSARQTGLFISDDIRATRKLTVSAGLRYEVNTPLTERHNRLTWTDLNMPVPSLDQSGLDITGADVYTTQDHRHPFNADWHDFGPRLGLAYQFAPKWVARGGYGLFYGLSSGQITGEFGDGYTSQTNYIGSQDGGKTIYSTLDNPFPTGLVPITGDKMGSEEELGTYQVHGPIPSWNLTPRIEQWSLGIERELPGNSVVEIAYTGSHGYHMGDGIVRDISNLYPVADMYKYGSQLGDQVTNPLYGYYPASATGAALNTPTVPLYQTLEPHPQFIRIHGRPGPPMGKSFYDAAYIRFTRRMAKGLQFTAHYAWSKSITNSETADDNNLDWLLCVANGCGGTRAYAQDWENLELDRSPDLSDITQRLISDFVYELPWGRGRTFGSHWNTALDSIAGGWKASGILTLQSGPPIAPHMDANGLLDNGNFLQRPNIVGKPATSGSVGSRLANYLNPGAFAVPPAFTFGDAPRLMGYARAPGWRSMDFSLFKSFYFTENRSRYLEFKAEAYNLTNSPVFGYPDSTYGDSAFGVIGSTVNGSRSMQLSLRLFF
jgi:hypothetical protein